MENTTIPHHITERGSNRITMSKLYTLIAFVLMATLVFAMPLALAEETENETPVADDSTDSVIAPAPDTTEVDAATALEINDDLNGSASGLRIGWERLKLGLTFNNEKKAMQELKIARLRLVQAKIAARNNDTEAMQNALEAHNRILERVQARVNAIDGASDEKGARNAAEKIVGLERAIEVHEARISKLNEILASENLTDEQRAKVEEKISKAEENTAKLRELEAEKKDKIMTKLRAVSNMTEEEANAVMAKIENNHNLSAVKNLVSEVRAQHMENVQNRIEIRQNVWNNLSEETQNEVKNAVRSEIEQRLESKSGSGKSQ